MIEAEISSEQEAIEQNPHLPATGNAVLERADSISQTQLSVSRNLETKGDSVLPSVETNQLNSDGPSLYRVFEFLAASVMLVLALPVIAIVALVLYLQGGGSVFYVQERVGKNGKTFPIYKFRTMFTDAESNGPFICTSYDDPRITKLGSLLRKTKLDELPQLLNVIKGEMALVGPRPERPHFHAEFSKFPGWVCRVSVRPGITGLAQISQEVSHDPEQKLRADMIYISNKSMELDLKIILFTILPKLKPKHLYGVPMLYHEQWK